MIARKIREEEFKRVDELFSVSFESKYDNDKTPREVIEEVKANPDSREAIFWQERYAAFVAGDGKVFFEDTDSDVLNYELQCEFDTSKGYTINEITKL